MPSINKLSKDDIIKLYSFVYEYETDIKQNVDHYNAKDNALKLYLKSNKIFIGPMNEKSSKSNYFRCNMRYGKKASHADLCHHIFRHIRNSIAHGLFEKKRRYFILNDYHNTKTELKLSATMKIEVKLFWSFIEELKRTYRV